MNDVTITRLEDAGSLTRNGRAWVVRDTAGNQVGLITKRRDDRHTQNPLQVFIGSPETARLALSTFPVLVNQKCVELTWARAVAAE